MSNHFFEGINGLDRPAKPRTVGRTMVVDWGMGLAAQRDFLGIARGHADFAKIAVGISRLLPNDLLTAKIETYQAADVEAFPGGQFLEYAEVQGKADLYMPAVAAAGYGWMEVSDNLASVSLEWKRRMIERAVKEFGLHVFGEVGKKEGLSSEHSMVDDAAACLDAGADIILLEAAELVSDDPQTAADVEAVVKSVGIETVMFELPGPWIAGIGPSDIHRMRSDLIARYGPNVNLGNVSPADLIPLEAYRRGLGANAGSVKNSTSG